MVYELILAISSIMTFKVVNSSDTLERFSDYKIKTPGFFHQKGYDWKVFKKKEHSICACW